MVSFTFEKEKASFNRERTIPKQYDREHVLALLERLKSVNPHVGVLGKTAEVVRGLYDFCSFPQFFWGSDSLDYEARDVVTVKVIGLGATTSYPFRNKGTVGIQTDIGMFYTVAAVETFGRITEDDFSKKGIVTLSMNQKWYNHMRFHDLEMEKSNHYNTVVDFVTSIGGNDDDVVATRYLLELADKKDNASMERLLAALNNVRNKDVYKQHLDYIREAI